METTTRRERLDIHPGAPVVSGPDQVGVVDRVVVSPGTGEVLGVVVRKGVFLRRDIVIPIGAISEASRDVVRVTIDSEHLNELPDYREQNFVAAPGDWRRPGERPDAGDGVGGGDIFRLPAPGSTNRLSAAPGGQTEAAAGARPLRAGQRVECRDGEVGRLDTVLIDPATGRATYFVVRRGRILTRDTIVPVEWVRDIERDRVYLDIHREQLNELPEYRPDYEITHDVLDALWYRSGLDPADLDLVSVETHDGIVELEGHTTSEETRAKVEAAAAGVRGVLGVRNNLDTIGSFEEAAHERGRRDPSGIGARRH